MSVRNDVPSLTRELPKILDRTQNGRQLQRTSESKRGTEDGDSFSQIGRMSPILLILLSRGLFQALRE